MPSYNSTLNERPQMSEDPHSLFETARSMHQAGQTEAAAQHYGNLLDLEPNYPHAGYLYAVALLSLDRSMKRCRVSSTPQSASITHPVGPRSATATRAKIKPQRRRAYQQALPRAEQFQDSCQLENYWFKRNTGTSYASLRSRYCD